MNAFGAKKIKTKYGQNWIWLLFIDQRCTRIVKRIVEEKEAVKLENVCCENKGGGKPSIKPFFWSSLCPHPHFFTGLTWEPEVQMFQWEGGRGAWGAEEGGEGEEGRGAYNHTVLQGGWREQPNISRGSERLPAQPHGIIKLDIYPLKYFHIFNKLFDFYCSFDICRIIME